LRAGISTPAARRQVGGAAGEFKERKGLRMLILERFVDESIYVGDVKIKVVEIRVKQNGKRCVRLGIEADREIPVHREEVYQARKAQAATVPE